MNWTEAHMMGDLEAMTNEIDLTPKMIGLLPAAALRSIQESHT